MSQSELQRFAARLQAEPSLVGSYQLVNTVEDLATRLWEDGYDVTDAEVQAAYQAGCELSDAQLDQVAGGILLELPIIAGVLAAIGILGTAAGLFIHNSVTVPHA